MKVVRISYGFSRMNASAVATMATNIVSKMSSEPSIYPSPNPPLQLVQNSILQLRESMTNASNKDGLMVKIRQEKKSIVENLLKLLSSYAVNITGGDKIALEKGGWKIIEKGPSVPLVPPTNPKLSFIQGKSGVLKLNWSGTKGNSYLIELTDQSPTLSTGWRFAGVTTKSKIIIQNLIPGTVYNFRIFSVRGTNMSGASPSVSSMAV